MSQQTTRPSLSACPAPLRRTRGGIPRASTLLPHLVEGAGTPAVELSPGTEVGGYVVQGALAQGGMSTVYAAIHPVIGKRAAIKVMTPALSKDDAAIQRFMAEARAVNEIRHPNIVDVFSYGHLEDGRSYLVMEWLEGQTLGDRMAAGRLTLAEGCDVLIQICEALDATHEKRIVHLDLKPDNVFLAPLRGGRTLVKLLDFGISKLIVGEPTPHAQRVTKFAGTPQYASPEQALGLQSLDGKSDAYSFGVMAYEIFSGQLPFKAANVMELLVAHVQQPPAPFDLSWAGSPGDLQKLVLELLYKSPERRPTLAEARDRLIAIRDLAARAPGVALVRRRPSVFASCVVASTVAALAFGVWAHFQGGDANAARRPLVASRPAMVAAPTVIDLPAPTFAPEPEPVVPTKPARPHRHRRSLLGSRPLAAATPRASDGDYLLDYRGDRR